MIRRKGPDPWLFSSCDYGALELCTLAQVCYTWFGYSAMREAINAKQDLHARLAARILGISYEEGLARKKAKDKAFANMRQAAKPVNFGLPGLMGAPKLVFTARKDGVVFCELAGESENCFHNTRVTTYRKRSISPTCEVCLKLAEGFIKIWREEWPEMVDYHKVTCAVADEALGGVPLDSFGSGMQRLEVNASAVSNHFFQNLAAQGAKRSLWLIQKAAYNEPGSVLYGNLRTCSFLHDETFCEIREKVAHEVAHEQARLMIVGMKEYVPDVEITVEPAIMRRWFKGAEKALKKDGVTLKPWWPVDTKCKWPEHHKAECGCWKYEPDQPLMAEDLAA